MLPKGVKSELNLERYLGLPKNGGREFQVWVKAERHEAKQRVSSTPNHQIWLA